MRTDAPVLSCVTFAIVASRAALGSAPERAIANAAAHASVAVTARAMCAAPRR